ncbi:MFS transporter [Sphingobacterium sp. T2]|uniref:MFS transporter n=1 Tax=Sphingobacterium sp. T2 TaxID=1590596 RepID=UPI00057B8D52|nr:MFS transporter [Sphingobacterium sp. T2]
MNSQNLSNQNGSSTVGPMIIIGALFFIFGFITWLNSLLIPYLKIACELSEFQAYLVTTAFYIAYLVMAPVSTWVLNKFGFKRGMSIALAIMAFGALLFIPAAYTRIYIIFLLGLFIIGGGLAILQTASNPYITILGPVETAAKRISIMGICNKLAGAVAPIILGLFLNLEAADNVSKQLETLSEAERESALSEVALQVVNPYIGIVVALLILAFWIAKVRLPEVQGVEEESEDHHVISEGKKKRMGIPARGTGFRNLIPLCRGRSFSGRHHYLLRKLYRCSSFRSEILYRNDHDFHGNRLYHRYYCHP